MAWLKSIKIGQRVVSEDSPVFIIAEIGSNHNQSLDVAKMLIEKSAESGADAAKFQSIKFDELHHAGSEKSSMRALFSQIELQESWYNDLLTHCNKCGIEFISSPTYYKAIDILTKLPAAAIKVASAQFGIHPWLVKEMARSNLPVIASTGLSTMTEMVNQLNLISSVSDKVILLHCVSQYPTDANRVNMKVMQHYRDVFDILVGFSDHTTSLNTPAIAVAMGAKVIEKHITHDKKNGRPGSSLCYRTR